MADHPYVSVSQMKTFRQCNRKWWIEKYGPFPPQPDTPSHVFGKGLHDAVEAYLQTGEVPPEYEHPERIAPAIRLGLLPKANVETTVTEERMDLDDIDPPMLGYIDVLDFDSGYGDGVVEVVDHKSYKSARYLLTEEQLRTDLQLIPYARFGLRVAALIGERTDKVRVSHIRYSSPLGRLPPRADKITAVVTSDFVEQQWQDVFVPLAAEMKEVARVAETMGDVEPNYNGCSAFGGCPYTSACEQLRRAGNGTGASPFAGIHTTAPSESSMSLADLVAKRKKKQAAQAHAPAKNSPGINSPEGPSESVTEKSKAPTTGLTTNASWNATSQSDAKMLECAERILDYMQDNQTNTVDFATAKAIVGEVCDLQRVAKKYIPVVAAASDGKLVHFAATDGLKAADDIDFTEPMETGAPSDPPEEAPTEGWAAADARGELANVLYVDCIPSAPGLDYTRGEMLVAQAEGIVAEANGGTDPLTMDYGKGRDAVANALRSLPIRWPVVISTMSPYAAQLRHVLAAQADMVVTGVR